jgi:uroporphyrin-III C-methyltransferase / precorrin-2 dehydrogenase / sirohydrochlorin ferrochelatase
MSSICREEQTVTSPSKELNIHPQSPHLRAARMAELAVLPLFMKLEGRRAVVAGGGVAAAWKAELLAAAGAHVEAFAPFVCAELAAFATAPTGGSITIRCQPWTPAELVGAAIAVGAMEDEAEAARFAAAAQAAGVPANIVDKPQLGSVQFGAIVNRSPLVVGISTGGAAPVFAQAIRARIEALLPSGFAHWMQAAMQWRDKIKRIGLDAGQRWRFWQRFADRAMTNAARRPGPIDFAALIGAVFGPGKDRMRAGFVSLVGAGPGDPELLTLQALRALRSADIILYDNLVAPALLEFARREASRLLVGKTGHGPSCQQGDINRLMIALAKAGKHVVRLKSGDPMIFGRGGEEMRALTEADVPFSVVPGISAVQGAAARLKVSLTHRDHARRVQFVSGHAQDGRLPDDLSWRDLSDPHVTTAIYMPRRTLAEMVARLLQAGLPGDCPAAAVFAATQPNERVILSRIADLPGDLQWEPDASPCLVLFGYALGELGATEGRQAERRPRSTAPGQAPLEAMR